LTRDMIESFGAHMSGLLGVLGLCAPAGMVEVG
jgi:hypothetical protein